MTRSDKVCVSALMADHLAIFYLFFTYWDVATKIGTNYTEITAFNLTNDLFDLLHHRWEQNSWSLKELIKDILSPNTSLGKEFFYLDHLKTSYQLGAL